MKFPTKLIDAQTAFVGKVVLVTEGIDSLDCYCIEKGMKVRITSISEEEAGTKYAHYQVNFDCSEFTAHNDKFKRNGYPHYKEIDYGYFGKESDDCFEIVQEISEVEAAREIVVNERIKRAHATRKEDLYASHITEEQKEKYLKEDLAYAEEIRQGKCDGNLAVSQCIYLELTGKTQSVLPNGGDFKPITFCGGILRVTWMESLDTHVLTLCPRPKFPDAVTLLASLHNGHSLRSLAERIASGDKPALTSKQSISKIAEELLGDWNFCAFLKPEISVDIRPKI